MANTLHPPLSDVLPKPPALSDALYREEEWRLCADRLAQALIEYRGEADLFPASAIAEYEGLNKKYPQT